MLHTLLESGAHTGELRAGWLASSVAVHGGIIALAIAVTVEHALPPRSSSSDPEPISYVGVQPPVPVSRESGRLPVPRSDFNAGIHVVVPDVPSVDIRALTPGALPGNVPGPEWRGGLSLRAPTVESSAGVYAESGVDRIVAPRAGNGSPAYPSGLRAAAIEGEVVVRFVVDTAGRVEPASVVILQTSHPRFADAVREWLSRTRYEPAQIGGFRVRQLVEQRVSFTLRP
jgi:protein TonB